jgi:hypothetical protein
MKWLERVCLAIMLINCSVDLGLLAAGARAPAWMQMGWVVVGTAAMAVAQVRGRRLDRLQQRIRELSDLLTRLLTDDVDAR